MANALKFHAVVQGKTLPLPDLSQFEGKRFEVLLVEDEREGSLVVPAGDESPRPLGLLRGQLRIPSDFDAPLPDEVLRLFEKAPSGASSLGAPPSSGRADSP